MSKREHTIAWGYMREGDKFLRYDSTANGTRVVIEREEPDLPTGVGSVIKAETTRGTEILAKVGVGDGARNWVSLSDSETVSIWRNDSDIKEYTPLVMHEKVLYGYVRDVFYDFRAWPAPSNALVEALTILANEGVQ